MTNSNIMIVEDNLLVAEDLKGKLSRMGYNIAASAKNGAQALEKAKECHPDLVLMDINLGDGIDGIEVAKEIREKYDSIIVYLTAYTDEETIKRAKFTEPHGFIVKPFDENEIKSTIDIVYHKKRAESFLAESHRWLETTLNSIGDAVIASDSNGNVSFINPVAQQLTGWLEAEAIGKPVREVFHIISEKTGKVEEDPVSRVLREKTIIGLANHTLLISKTGEKIPIADSGAPICNDDGEVIGVVLVFRDQTDERKYQKNLEQSENYYRELFENNTAMKLLIDPDTGRVVDANSSACKFYQYSLDEIKTLKIWEINQSSQSKVQKDMAAVVTKDKAEFLFKHKLASGEVRDVHVYSGLVETHGKKLLHSIIVDVTDQVKAEKALIESEKKFHDLYDNSPDMYVSVDAKTSLIKECNQTLASKLGYTKEEIINRPISEVYHPDSLDSSKTQLQNFITTGKVDNTELQLRKKDGTSIDVILNMSAVRDDKGDIIFSRSAWRDITDYKQIVREKKELEKKLLHAQKMESIGTLAGGIAHDFNNILSSILGFTELAMADTNEMTLETIEKISMLQDSLHEIHIAGNRAKKLVKQILSFARQSEEELKPIRLGEIIKEVVKFMRSSIPSSIEINTNIGSKSRIMGNQTQIHQVIMNLCTNSAHSLEEKGGNVDVVLEDIIIDNDLENQKLDLTFGEYIKLSVSDTGKGISDDIIDSIFDPYFTTKEPGKGTGMGLAMVHGIIERYGGKITVKSQLGKGTTFVIYLPVTHKQTAAFQPLARDWPTGTERILLVDDEASIAKMETRALKNLGYAVIESTSSLKALELFRSKPEDFDLVITDMTMPGMTGDILTSELMAVRHDIPVILCTGYSNKMSDEKAAEIGAKAFLYKPVTMDVMAKTVRDVLDKVENPSC